MPATSPSEPSPWIEALDPATLVPRRMPLAASSDGTLAATLRAVPGAEVVHIPLGLGADLLCRCELPTDANGQVQLRLRPAGDGLWQPDELPALRLLAAEYPAPPPPLAAEADVPWQVAFLIDRTARWYGHGAPGGPLLATPAHWATLRGQLTGYGQALAQAGQVQFAVLGFADAPIPEAAAADLRPQGPVPGLGERFQPWDERQADSALAVLPASSGGDWVDALAEALVAAAGLPWAADARRLVLLCGDSPGYALRHPISATADALAREQDVDLAAALLYARGIELVTVWQRPPEPFVQGLAGPARAILTATGAQYARLATGPAHALEATGLDPAALAAALRGRTGPLARGACLGLATDG